MEQALRWQDIQSGREACPVEGEKMTVEVPHPGDNVVGPAAARASRRCSLCGLDPDPGDFKKRS